jgi:putative flippase GtrA
MRQLALFGVAGVIGFVVDAGVLQLIVSVFGGNPYASRLLSFLCAATATWTFNRHFTFGGPRHYSLLGEWARYVFAMSGGFALNASVYWFLIWHSPLVHRFLVLGVGAGSIAGMTVNYSLSKLWIYRHRRPSASSNVGLAPRAEDGTDTPS